MSIWTRVDPSDWILLVDIVFIIYELPYSFRPLSKVKIFGPTESRMTEDQRRHEHNTEGLS